LTSSAPVPLPRLTLVLGGARSGKSRYGEGLIEAGLTPGDRAVYLATAEAGDAEMTARIAEHKQRRGRAWLTVEEPLDIVGALARHAKPESPVLLDCLTLWLSNVIAADRDAGAEIVDLVAALSRAAGPVVLVSNEVGQGIVPDNALARFFTDNAGRMNQAVATAVGRVVLMSAGLPLILKDENA
jgi:adenosylcobinamide kinase / adenosylcobinamide-phosphate guanylyltransferase